MSKKWKFVDWVTCPECGGQIEAYTDGVEDPTGIQEVYSGDRGRCIDDECGITNLRFVVDEDGDSWVEYE